ncbi:MAG: arylesterase [Nitrospirae bacterium]|nr:arylesterase [Nitrospirota bacterium]
MRNILKHFGGFILILTTIATARGDQNFIEKSSHLIVAFGNSLTAGYGVTPDEAYPALLERRLRENHFSYRVLNAGISGETTSGGLSRIDEVIRHNPEIVILELGANDGLRGVPLGLIESNLGKMIGILQKRKIKVLLAGMKLPPNYGADYTDGFHQMYFRLAKKYRLKLIPFLLEGTAAKEGLNQADGLHPTAEGYKIVLVNVWNYLVPLLR